MGIDRAGRVYPRAYGGTSCVTSIVSVWSGLSPRVRGNPMPARSSQSSERSIPARTGEPDRPFGVSDAATVYPRAYGGTAAARAPSKPAKLGGLSPRVRGNRARIPKRRLRWGSIPARTGEPARRRRAPTRARVYPRAYGGTSASDTYKVNLRGLSPRVRGNLTVR